MDIYTNPIIVADDDVRHLSNLLDALANKFRIEENKISFRMRGDDLVDAVLKGNYGVIITDDWMQDPEHTGRKSAKKIRDAGITTPIFLYSSNVFKSEEDWKPYGVTQVFRKGREDLEKLLTAVEEVYKTG